ncbi:PPC domain-containing protein [Zavarzinella formosa]|uniref:PPC domain-containing protein n=1 Tax=Zavarzinella formosa TaxID=360055 RepID=UPI0002DA6045|nr:PPC domain-containing protein [Zavarzinella formosa]
MMRSLLPALVLFVPAFAQNKDKPKDPPPKPLYSFQLAVEPGKPTKLTIRGLRLDTATDIRVQEPKSTGKVLGKGRKSAVGNQQSADVVGDSEIDVEVTVPPEVAGGLLAISLIGPGGESKPCAVAINDDTPRLAEKEPNDGFKEAMPLTVPVVVTGGFKQAQDADVFKFEAKAGEEYAISVQAKRLGSPADVLLSLYNADQRVIATGEAREDNPDPALTVKIPKDGPYFISLLEGNDQGGNNFNYRLIVRKTK